jgi:hypothetical protein
MVSDVGRTTSGSSSFEAGSTISSPSGPWIRRVWVTSAISLAKPSTCLASRAMKLSGMNSGKYAFWWPVALNISSSARCMSSQMA